MSKKDYDKVDIGRRIRTIRQNKGMTLKEFGKLFGTSKSIVYRWENGTSLPNAERLQAISKIAEISTTTLLYGSIKERISKVLYKLSLEDKQYKNIDIKSFTRSIYHSLPSTEISQKDLENYIKKDLDEWFSKEQTPTFDDLTSILEFHSKTVYPVLNEKLKETKKNTSSNEKVELLNKLISIQNDFFSNLEKYISLELQD